jgi:hypothetical protein
MAEIVVRTLLCHRDVDLAVDCLGSLLACCADPIALAIHEDGSLTAEDRARLAVELPGARIVDRRVSDEMMRERLARHAAAQAFRAGSVWGLKLLDVALLEPGDCYYVDGDVRFFRRFRGLFCREALAGGAVFLRDTVWAAYSVRPWHLLDRRGLRVCEAINTGLTLIDRACFDLDFVDWFLHQPDWRVIPAWTEPTCWAALALRSQARAVHPDDVTNLYPSARVTPATVGAHFLSAYRSGFAAEFARTPVTDGEAARVRQAQLGALGPLGLGLNQLKRKVGNEWKRRRQS